MMIWYSKRGRNCYRFCRLRNYLIHFLLSHCPSMPRSKAEPLLHWINQHCPRYDMTEQQATAWCEEQQ